MASDPQNRSSILLADPDPESVEVLVPLLQTWNYEIETVRDGVEGFKRLLAPDAPAIAILDDNLPHMRGIEIIAEIKRRSRPYS